MGSCAWIKRSNVRYKRSLVTALSGTPSRSSNAVDWYQCSANANSLHGAHRRLMTSMATMSAGRTVSFPWGRWRSTIASRWRNFQSQRPSQTSPKARGLVQPTLPRRIRTTSGSSGVETCSSSGKRRSCWGPRLAVVEDDGALPATLLVVVEFAEVGDDVLTRPGLGADAFDEGVVGVGLAVLGAGVAAQEHDSLLVLDDGQECVMKSRC